MSPNTSPGILRKAVASREAEYPAEVYRQAAAGGKTEKAAGFL